MLLCHSQCGQCPLLEVHREDGAQIADAAICVTAEHPVQTLHHAVDATFVFERARENFVVKVVS